MDIGHKKIIQIDRNIQIKNVMHKKESCKNESILRLLSIILANFEYLYNLSFPFSITFHL